MRRRLHLFLLALISVTTVTAQTQDQLIKQLEQQGYRLDTTLVATRDTVVDAQVVTNPFWHNLFITADGGMHSFRGDFSSYGKFNETLSYHWFAGIGKWFTPVTGIKLLFGMGESRGFMDKQYPTPYCYGDLLTSDDNSYWKTRNRWWEVGVNGMVNLSRAVLGYEGPNSEKMKNQFMLNFGIGYVHHTGMKAEDFVDDDWSGRLELQYSRFFSKKKNISLDLKARLLAYQTNFDKHTNHTGSSQWDANIGVAVGMTFYLKHYDWGYNAKTKYTTNYLTQTIVQEQTKAPEYGQLTFYVFYPNNYSGRNDAPQVATATVNAIDYLAGGLYTQKKYNDNTQVAQRLAGGKSPIGLAYSDIPTVKASTIDTSDGMAHGYEMCNTPLSLSMERDSLVNFRGKKEYYYAPIWDGQHAWHYRIDDATKGQNLLSDANYKETESYGLNGANGLAIVRENLFAGGNNDQLFSFADVYAALEGNTGYVSQYADGESVAKLRRIFNEGTITSISATGVATSQNNNNAQTGYGRNTALAQNRAATVLTWLQNSSSERLKAAHAQTFLVNELEGPIRKVDDTSTRGLSAKLNRCVKVCINYMIK